MKTHCKNGHRRRFKNGRPTSNLAADGTTCKICAAFRNQQNGLIPKNRRRHREYQRRRRQETQLRLIAYLKDHPCVDCGETDVLVLEFDHRRDKKFCVASLMSWKWENVLLEIQKCDVVCANDHCRRTARRAKTFRYRNT